MKELVTIILIALAPAFVEGAIEWLATSFLIGWLALAIVVVVFACLLLAHRTRDDEPNYYKAKERNTQ